MMHIHISKVGFDFQLVAIAVHD